MNLELSNKTALVTGASSGIGAATANVLAAEGADVVVSYGQDQDGADRTAEVVKSQGRRAWLCQMDVSSPESVFESVQRLRDTVKELDILLLCAGQNAVTPFEKLTSDEWNRIITINLSGAFYVLQALIPHLRDGASVVMVSSVAAHTGAPHHAHYAAAKAGLVNLAKTAARACASIVLLLDSLSRRWGKLHWSHLRPTMPNAKFSPSDLRCQKKLRGALSLLPVQLQVLLLVQLLTLTAGASCVSFASRVHARVVIRAQQRLNWER